MSMDLNDFEARKNRTRRWFIGGAAYFLKLDDANIAHSEAYACGEEVVSRGERR